MALSRCDLGFTRPCGFRPVSRLERARSHPTRYQADQLSQATYRELALSGNGNGRAIPASVGSAFRIGSRATARHRPTNSAAGISSPGEGEQWGPSAARLSDVVAISPALIRMRQSERWPGALPQRGVVPSCSASARIMARVPAGSRTKVVSGNIVRGIGTSQFGLRQYIGFSAVYRIDSSQLFFPRSASRAPGVRDQAVHRAQVR
jgi:hypothetical protein